MVTALDGVYLSAKKALDDAGVSSAALEARELTCLAAGIGREFFHAALKSNADRTILAELDGYIKRRLDGEPLAYILGEWDFMGRTFFVGPGALIPRADTEALAMAAIKALEKRPPGVFLDLCCGTGCIGLSACLAVPRQQLHLGDISEAALEYARKNAALHMPGGCTISRMDAQAPPPSELCDRFDVIACNPPYISAEELRSLGREVAEYEPIIALDGGEDGLEFYRSLLCCWPAALKPDGVMALECGYAQAPVLAWMAAESGLANIEVIKDVAGVDRVVTARRP